MSKGLSENDAKKLITQGYFMPVIKLLENEYIKNKIGDLIFSQEKWN